MISNTTNGISNVRNVTSIEKRPDGKIPTTAVTNEIVEAMRKLGPVPSLGQVEDRAYGAEADLPVPTAKGQVIICTMFNSPDDYEVEFEYVMAVPD